MMDRPFRQPFDQEASSARSRRLKLAGHALAICSLAYMLPHLYWALGGKAGLAGIHPAAPALPQWHAINWFATVVLSAVSLLGLAFASDPRGRIARPLLLLIAWAGCSLAVSHALYGIGSRSLSVIHHISAKPAQADLPAFILVDLFVFEPWFLIEGILLGLCGWFCLSSGIDRRHWLAACGVGTLAALVAALLNVKMG